MSVALSWTQQTERLEDLVSAFGQTALATTGLLVGVAGGLLAVSGREVVIESRHHRLLRFLLALLLAVSLVWIVARMLGISGMLSSRHLYVVMRDVAYAQGGLLLVCLILIGLVVQRLGRLVQVADR